MPSSSSSFLSVDPPPDEDCFLVLSSCPCSLCPDCPPLVSNSKALTNSSRFPLAAAVTASAPRPNCRMTGPAWPDCKADQNIDSAWENWGDDSVVQRLSPGGKCAFISSSKFSDAEIADGMEVVNSVATPLCRTISCAVADREQQSNPEEPLPQLLSRAKASDSQEKFMRRTLLSNVKNMPLVLRYTNANVCSNLPISLDSPVVNDQLYFHQWGNCFFDLFYISSLKEYHLWVNNFHQLIILIRRYTSKPKILEDPPT